MTQEIIIPVCLILFSVFVGWVQRTKAKSDKAEIKEVIEVDLKAYMIPIEKRMKEVEQTNQYLRTGVQRLETSNEVEKERSKSMIEALNRNSDLFEKFTNKIEDMFEKQESKNRENFLLIFEKLEKKQDRKT